MLGVKEQRKQASMAPVSFLFPSGRTPKLAAHLYSTVQVRKKLVNILTFSSASLDGPLLY